MDLFILLLVRNIRSFPNEFTGAGILIVRITLAAALCNDALSHLNGGELLSMSPTVGALVLAALVLLGIFTSIAAAILFVLTSVCGAFGYRPLEISLLLAGLSLSLTVFGPGAWSLDARLFGLKRVQIDIDRGR